MPSSAAHLVDAFAARVAGADAPDAASDFRIYVFVAYGAVLVLLGLFTLWSVAQVAAAKKKMEQLERRLDLQEKAGNR